MKKIFLSLILCLILLCTGCSAPAPVGVDSSELEPFLIGGVVPLTENWGSYGISAKNGASLAVSEINATGGVNGFRLVLNFQDSKGDPELIPLLYEKLKGNGARALLGGTFSDEAAELTLAASQDGILTILTSAAGKDVLKERGNAFRLRSSAARFGADCAALLSEDKMRRNVAVIYSDDVFDSRETAEAFLAACAKTDMFTTPILLSAQAPEEEIIRSIREVPAGQYDVVLLAVSPHYTRLFLEEFVGAGEKILLTRLPEGGLSREGALLADVYFADDGTEVTKNFSVTYEEAFGEIPDRYAADAYDAVYAVAQAIQRAGITPDRDNTPEWNAMLAEAMTRIRMRGVSGELSWTKEGESEVILQIKEFRKGKFVPYEPEDLRSGS